MSSKPIVIDQFLQSSFDALLKLREVPPTDEQKHLVVRDKLESVLARLDRLKDAPWNEPQHERWVKLFE